MALEIRGTGLNKIAVKDGERYTGEKLIKDSRYEKIYEYEYYKDGKLIRKIDNYFDKQYKYEKDGEKSRYTYTWNNSLYFDIKEEFGELHEMCFVYPHSLTFYDKNKEYFFDKISKFYRFFKEEIRKDKFISYLGEDTFGHYKFPKGKYTYINFKIPYYYGEIDGDMEIYGGDSSMLGKFIFKNGNLIEKIYY